MDNDYYFLKVPQRPRFAKTEASFSYIWPRTWNDLPYCVGSINDLKVFLKSLKTH